MSPHVCGVEDLLPWLEKRSELALEVFVARHAATLRQVAYRMTVGAQVETPAPTIRRLVVGVMPLSTPVGLT